MPIARIAGAPRRYLRYARAARALQAQRPSATDLAQTVAFAYGFEFAEITISPVQVRSEIMRFGELVQGLSPRGVLEIGTQHGGTFFILASVAADDATLVSVDCTNGAGRRALLRSMARGRQQVVPLRAYSYDAGIVDRVRERLGGPTLDLLFIDGGHSYETVSGDLRRFAPLVRPGGLIAFHDILPSAWGGAGDVPQFWADIRDSYESEEIVGENPERDGMGIGVLRIDSTPGVR